MDPVVLHGVEARLLSDGVELAAGGGDPAGVDVERLREAVGAWLDALDRSERTPSILVPFEPGDVSAS